MDDLEEKVKNWKLASGSIEVICGPMFSGKTEELIRRLKGATLAQLKVKTFKPVIDNRYDSEQVVSHDQTRIASTPVDHSASILLLAQNCEVVGIDEGQFFDEGIVEICETLANKGVRVIIAGLDMDFQGRPFGPMPKLMAIAEHVTKIHAICMRCGSAAPFSYRLNQETKTILLGEKNHYEPRCRACFFKN